jgi:hypothetical protein
MNALSYKSIWVKEYERNEEYYNESFDPFANWEDRTRHASIAQMYLDHGLSAKYSNAQEAIARKFFFAAIQVVNRAEKEMRLEGDEISKGAFPINRGIALRARAYSTALTEQLLPKQDLVQASLDFLEWCKSYSRGEWDGQGQANYLASVRAALIAGDKESFTSLLNYKWPFNYHSEESDILRAMANEFQVATVIRNNGLTKRFRAFFDKYRDPVFKPDVFLEKEIVRFELGVLWCRYFDSSSSVFSWQRVVESVSY